MTNTLKTSIIALSAMFAVAGAAQADGVKISTLGKSREAVRNEVVQAARTVCDQAVSADIHDVYGSMDECVNATVDATFAKLANTSASVVVASQSLKAH
jgi:hypothetical protein